MKLTAGFAALPIAALALAAPASAEKITSYWRLDATMPVGAVSAGFDAPFFQQKMLPAGLARLSADALPAEGKAAVAAGTWLYEVVNAEGKKGYCISKDMSAGNQAKSLFIPALDKRPCFVDSDGDGRFDASFQVFEAYTVLSPPQPRGSIDGAKPMAAPVAFELADPAQYPVEMTISYRLLKAKTIDRTRMQVTVDRAGRSESVTVGSQKIGDVRMLGALGMAVLVKSGTPGADAELDLTVARRIYVYALDNGTVAVPELPALGMR